MHVCGIGICVVPTIPQKCFYINFNCTWQGLVTDDWSCLDESNCNAYICESVVGCDPKNVLITK